ncbi:MAG TPA: MBL fold metallo-hydrolase, partial [Mycobacteriales bacterium]|nr:MBL fold metallo-hydrolase [Mycobacteriales bacterium]
EVGVGSRTIGPFQVDTVRSNHPVECHAMRLTAGGRSLTYSGDTGECPDLVELARGTDLFLCEASWTHSPDNPPGVHLSGREAGEHAAQAGVGRLVVTHVVAWADPDAVVAEARAAFDGPVEQARCGTTTAV